MEHATEILVIITSSVLVVFLLLGITSLIAFLVLLKRLGRLVHKAENAAEAVESFSAAARNLAQSVTVSSMVGSFVKSFVSRSGKKEK